jgi:DNA end-binding protein Ku
VAAVPETRHERRPAADEAETKRLRPFWSGTIAFGLVSLPVNLYAANRASRVSLRMIDASGTPLTRRYFPADGGEPLAPEQIVRGRSVDDGRFVVVEDDELEGLAPEKSQEIDLTRFVDATEIDPTYFGRSYFLAPDRGAQRAYRLLARTMEEAGKAGIATFVMRGKEYLVAILAEQGILRAETLRFHDEVRSPAGVGLPALEEPDAQRLRRLEGAMEHLAAQELDRSLLRDRASRRLLALVETKRAAGEAVVELPEPLAEEVHEPVDLMALLKRSLTEDGEEQDARGDRAAGGTGAGGKRRTGASARGGNGARGSGAGTGAKGPSGGKRDLERRSKAELYERAQELDIAGRSAMTKQQLVDAIRDAS